MQAFGPDLAASTIVAVDVATQRSVGFVSFLVTDLAPFGIDVEPLDESYLVRVDVFCFLKSSQRVLLSCSSQSTRRQYLCYIYVDAQFGRRGIAKRLLDEAVAWARKPTLRSSFVDFNDGSRRWHAQMGFKPYRSVWRFDR